MPTIISRGGMAGKAFGLTGSTAAPVYVEDVFSTYLYTGNGSTQTITNNIDLSTKGGMVWLKSRTTGGSAYDNALYDTVRGNQYVLSSNLTSAQLTNPATREITAFNTNGFNLGPDWNYFVNSVNNNYVSWTFREQPKFFDVVNFTGNGANRTIAHNLGATPGMIIVKRTDVAANWQVYHVGLTSAANSIQLNLTAAQASATTVWNSTAPTSTVFSVGTDATVNASGGTYVAYIYANQAGGFGLSGSDSVVACGSYTGNGSASGPSVTLGWEPQFVMIKVASAITSNWLIFDNMRGIATGGNASYLYPNSSAAELSAVQININATGFSPTTATGTVNASGSSYIYLAIRRGPMKVPTSATSVFSPSFSVGSFPSYVTPFPVDFSLNGDAGGADKYYAASRLTGTGWLYPPTTAAEATSSSFRWDSNTGCIVGWPSTFIGWNFGRAPGYMDVVCYTATGSGSLNVAHSLSAIPQMMIVKGRSSATDWPVYHIGENGGVNPEQYYLRLNAASFATNAVANWGNTAPTATQFTVAGNNNAASGFTYIAYLFTTCPGVSKVGSYTGTGAAQNINCGFSAGSRFVLIKRTDSTGDWYTYDSVRGISSGNDPYLLLNTTAGQVTGTNYVDTFASGFTLTATAPAALNGSGGSFIFLAIA